jgi:hypothetical protein
LSILACWPFTDLSWFSVDSNRFSGERHPLLLREVAVHQILGRDLDLLGAIGVGGLLAFVAAEDPHGGQNQPDASDPGEQHSLLAAHRFAARQFASDRRDPALRLVEGLRYE